MTLNRLGLENIKVLKDDEQIEFAVLSDVFPQRSTHFEKFGKTVTMYFVQVCLKQHEWNIWDSKPSFLRIPKHTLISLVEMLSELDYMGHSFIIGRKCTTSKFPTYTIRPKAKSLTEEELLHINSLPRFDVPEFLEETQEIRKILEKKSDEVEILMKKIGYQIAHVA